MSDLHIYDNPGPKISLLREREQKHNCELLKNNCENKLYYTCFHKHCFTCEKTLRGKYICRLCMARGLNEKSTRPLMIQLIDKGSMADNVKAKVMAHELDENMMRYIDELIDYSKHFKKEDLPVPIIWE